MLESSHEKNSTIISALAVIAVGAAAYVYFSKPAPSTQQGSAQTTTTEQTTAGSTYTAAQVSTHTTPQDCWVIVKGNVYDLSNFDAKHPGGSEPIKGLCGTDGTEAFAMAHNTKRTPNMVLDGLKIGQVGK